MKPSHKLKIEKYIQAIKQPFISINLNFFAHHTKLRYLKSILQFRSSLLPSYCITSTFCRNLVRIDFASGHASNYTIGTWKVLGARVMWKSSSWARPKRQWYQVRVNGKLVTHDNNCSIINSFFCVFKMSVTDRRMDQWTDGHSLS